MYRLTHSFSQNVLAGLQDRVTERMECMIPLATEPGSDLTAQAFAIFLMMEMR